MYNAFVTRGAVPIAQVRNVPATSTREAGDRAVQQVRRDFDFGPEISLMVQVKQAPVGQTFVGYCQIVDMRQLPIQARDRDIRQELRQHTL